MNPGIKRRLFLKGSVTAAAALGFPTVISAKAFGANDRISIGLIGAGGRGLDNMRNFLGLDGCRVVAVCDVQRDRVQKAKELVDQKYGDKGCAMFGDFRDLIARKDIDAVIIAPQDHWHSLVATAAAAAGKDMFCEKPTGVCINDGFATRAALRRNKRVYQSGTWQRSLGNFRQGAELALNGYLGKISEVQVAVPGKSFQPGYKGSLDPQPVPEGFDWAMWQGPARYSPFNAGRVAYPDWYLLNDYCEGWTTNWGVHHLDIANWGVPALGAEPFEIECGGTYYMNKGFADNIETWKATLTYASGLRMVFSDDGQQPCGTRFIGEKGWVHVNRGDRISASAADLLTIRPKAGDVRLLPPDSLSFDDVTTIKTKEGDRVGYKKINHWQGLLDAMRSRKDTISNIDATHTASTLGMIAGIAARLQQKLKWDWKSERFVGSDLANAMLVRPMHNGWKLEA